MTTPHASWAEFYDTAYVQSFGELYLQLTSATIEQIQSRIKPPASIVDFGAGTGRLSAPLASLGYRVVAVDPCEQMLDQIAKKPGGDLVSIFTGRLQDFGTDTPFDMAICVFTVLLYLLDKNSLEKSVSAIAKALRPGGLLLIDIPSKQIFRDYQISSLDIRRTVNVSPRQGDLYLYEEHTTLFDSRGNHKSYSDSFFVKYWEEEYVMQVLIKHGFSVATNLAETLSGTGSLYFVMEKGD